MSVRKDFGTDLYWQRVDRVTDQQAQGGFRCVNQGDPLSTEPFGPNKGCWTLRNPKVLKGRRWFCFANGKHLPFADVYVFEKAENRP